MSLTTPIKVEKLQKALHAKAKEEAEVCFYQLYDKIYRPDVLAFAYRLCRANDGAPGVDGQTFEQIESLRLTEWLDELAKGLRNKAYRYFCLGPVSKAYGVVDAHTRHRLRQWLCGKHKVDNKGTARYPDEYLYEQLDRVRLSQRTRNLPWAKA
ncbi:MAG: hypothetical protein EA417_21875 [Gammaproteobacteria bacterium]|nr:MAG: hypothetical protein EA417_21875 [Gammaproteobacteria bacterium]